MKKKIWMGMIISFVLIFEDLSYISVKTIAASL